MCPPAHSRSAIRHVLCVVTSRTPGAREALAPVLVGSHPMRPLVKTFVKDCAELFAIDDPVVEIGARPAEGQEQDAYLRDLFPGAHYIGCDIQEGPNVDQIEDIHQLS